MRATLDHTNWCAGGHRCNFGEHRAHPVTIHTPSAGSAVLTRIRAADGTEHAEIRLSVILPSDDAAARQRLAALLTHLRTLIGPPAIGNRAKRTGQCRS